MTLICVGSETMVGFRLGFDFRSLGDQKHIIYSMLMKQSSVTRSRDAKEDVMTIAATSCSLLT
jgi:hypothetical protein